MDLDELAERVQSATLTSEAAEAAQVLLLAFTFFFYNTARLLVPVLTLGWIRVQRKAHDELVFGWFGFARDSDRRPVMAASLAALVGVLLWVVAIALAYVRLT